MFDVLKAATSIIYDDDEDGDDDQVTALVDQLKDSGFSMKAVSSGLLPDDMWWEKVQLALHLKTAQVAAARRALNQLAERGKCI